MSRDQQFQQVADRFAFPVDDDIKIGGKYTPVLLDGDLAYVAGQIPRIGETVHFIGDAGGTLSLEEARRAAGVSALRALTLIRRACGSLDAIVAVPRISVFVRSAPDFTQQSEVADGASDVLFEILGDAGVHTRTSVGVLQLPKGAVAEVDFIFRVRTTDK